MNPFRRVITPDPGETQRVRHSQPNRGQTNTQNHTQPRPTRHTPAPRTRRRRSFLRSLREYWARAVGRPGPLVRWSWHLVLAAIVLILLSPLFGFFTAMLSGAAAGLLALVTGLIEFILGVLALVAVLAAILGVLWLIGSASR